MIFHLTAKNAAIIVSFVLSLLVWVLLPVPNSYVYAMIFFPLCFMLVGYSHFTGWKSAMRGHIRECEAHHEHMKELAMETKTAVASITKAEQNVITSVNQLIDDFVALGEDHEGEHDAFQKYGHDMMALIYARVGLRSSVQFQLLEEQHNASSHG